MLSRRERTRILAKTGQRCHICGGPIAPRERWQADHVLARSGGGGQAVDNYLPAHAICNNYRWDYLPDESQLILKLGVWTRTQVERGTSVGRAVAVAFVAHQERRERRRRHSASGVITEDRLC
jgi:hypothetical protein